MAAIIGIVGVAIVLYLISWIFSTIVSGVATTLTADSIASFGIPATMVILLGVIVVAFVLGRGKKRP